MRFERFTDDGLDQFSYAIAGGNGEVAVVDPRRDVEVYLRFARDHGLRITHVLETHIHADYASGALELAQRAGAPLHLSAHDEGERYRVGFQHEDLRDGEDLRVGDVRIRAVHTPGHTPEHLSFLVLHDDGEEPVRLLTGDFLLVGSLGRPDLLGEDAREALARALHDSVRRVLPGLPDSVRIHPAHGSKSMCGAGMGDEPESTLGAERSGNPYLDPSLDVSTFTRRLLDSLPTYPAYYLRMKERNTGGPGFTLAWPEPRALEPREFRRRWEDDHVVVDVRHQLGFGGGHVPGALGIGLDPDLSPWAGWVVPYDRPLLLVAETPADVPAAVTRLARVGLDRIEGYLAGGMDAWVRAGGPLATTPQLSPAGARAAVDEGIRLLDVRTDEEWRAGHVEEAIHVPAEHLQDRVAEVPDRGTPIAVTCATGYRSTVAASILERSGFSHVHNLAGGMTAWQAAGLPTVAD